MRFSHTFRGAGPSARRVTFITAAALAVLQLVPAAHLTAQSGTDGRTTGSIEGIVSDARGVALRDVRVRVAGADAWVRTDATGAYRLDGVPAGSQIVQFVADSDLAISVAAPVERGAATSVDPVLPRRGTKDAAAAPAAGLTSVVHRPSQALEAFAERAQRGGGHYITRAALSQLALERISESVRRLPGFTVTDGVIALRSRGYDASGGCRGAAVYLDGMPILNEGTVLTTLDAIPTRSYAGVEAYNATGPAAPVQGYGNPCGTVLFWTLP